MRKPFSSAVNEPLARPPAALGDVFASGELAVQAAHATARTTRTEGMTRIAHPLTFRAAPESPIRRRRLHLLLEHREDVGLRHERHVASVAYSPPGSVGGLCPPTAALECRPVPPSSPPSGIRERESHSQGAFPMSDLYAPKP